MRPRPGRPQPELRTEMIRHQQRVEAERLSLTGNARALVVEGDAAMAAGTLPPPGSMHQWFPAVVTESPIGVLKKAI